MARAQMRPSMELKSRTWRCLGVILFLSALVSLWNLSTTTTATISHNSLVSTVSSWTSIFSGWGRDLQHHSPSSWPSNYGSPINALEELHSALETMQDEYFQIWLGKWPSSIDWTGAVLGTFVSASLFSLTRTLEYVLPPRAGQAQWKMAEREKVDNEINRYFSQSVAYYFGEDAFSIRLQAYDDMLWVVLGWLEAVRFIDLHNGAHYASTLSREGSANNVWYGKQFVPGFAHRANIFYDIASQGWDTKLCGGGMTWNPRLTPYKNAITNQLYLSASIGMYLYFPGDRNPSPYLTSREYDAQMVPLSSASARAQPHDPAFLKNAIDTYDWLKKSNMTNSKGLYVDGFHITGWNRNGSTGTGQCDERNEMVYTYNQGVLLSGLRGLWEATGNVSYLQDGHDLVRKVIAATGWQSSLEHQRWWSGLGRNGIMEEVCDWSGSCSQNGQTFKGIFFHHLTLFCAPLPMKPLLPGKTHRAGPAVYNLHAQSCREYTTWVVWNARAALATRDSQGRFGAWWGANLRNASADEDEVPPIGAVDYRNAGLGEEERWGVGWREGLSLTPPMRTGVSSQQPRSDEMMMEIQEILDQHADLKKRNAPSEDADPPTGAHLRDVNDRGRGRTVETQGGGVAVLRALWEFVNTYGDLK